MAEVRVEEEKEVAQAVAREAEGMVAVLVAVTVVVEMVVVLVEEMVVVVKVVAWAGVKEAVTVVVVT
eukprot:25098-Prymnesium_polylepis.1